MSTAVLKRELALLRSSLAALKPSQSATVDDPVAWAERIAELTLDPGQRDVPAAPQCHATERQEHSGRAQSGLDRAAGRSCGRGLAFAAAVGLSVPQAFPPPCRLRRASLVQVAQLRQSLPMGMCG